MSPDLLCLGVLGIALVLYALLGGADFGAGIWELNLGLQPSDADRRLVQRAIGPVWEANHVWLVFAIVVAHTAFPVAYGAVSRALWLPLFLALAGIVLRGASFVLRAYSPERGRQSAAWGVVFALASTAAPFFLGACVGSLASGKLAVDVRGRFDGDRLVGWITPLGVYSAFFAVGLCAYLASVYFCREARRERELAETWRRRALATGSWTGILAAVGLVLLAREAPALWKGMLRGPWVLIALSALCGLGSLAALGARHYGAATVAAAGAVAAVLAGWMLGQYPLLVPPVLEVRHARAPDSVLWATVWSALAGSVILLPSLAALFVLFKVEGSAGRTDA